MFKKYLAVIIALTFLQTTYAKTFVYHNPILFSDYSDPDVIRDGHSYYLVASSFHFVPGIPVLQSDDLAHWKIIGHVVQRMEMSPQYNLVEGNRYGGGIWAPSIRKHNGLFYVYFPTPNEGIFVSTSTKITGPWTIPVAVISQAGLEDPCPFWDDDGSAYLIHSKVGAGPLILHRMSADGKRVLDEGKVIVQDHKFLPVLEGPKLYKRNGYYYIFAPDGGVATGQQVVLRAHNIYGPYEHKIVLSQGTTTINGPHQGGYVESPDGHGWFIHFQSRGAHGRILHLEPVRWENDWPIMGTTQENKTEGQPVESAYLSASIEKTSHQKPQTSDEFNEAKLGQQWEWNHNPEDSHWSLKARKGYLRLVPMPASELVAARNTITQNMQDNSFEFTARIDLAGMKSETHTGLAMFEKISSGIEIVQSGSRRWLNFFHAQDHTSGPEILQKNLQLRVCVKGDIAVYSYSLDNGHSFKQLGSPVLLTFSWWKGARPSLFAYTAKVTDPGFVDFDWVHYRSVGNNPW
jgi:beta-xylosidase